MSPTNKQIQANPARPAALFFNTCLGGYTPGLFNSTIFLIVPKSKNALKIKKITTAVFIPLSPYTLVISNNSCNYLYDLSSIPMKDLFLGKR